MKLIGTLKTTVDAEPWSMEFDIAQAVQPGSPIPDAAEDLLPLVLTQFFFAVMVQRQGQHLRMTEVKSLTFTAIDD